MYVRSPFRRNAPSAAKPIVRKPKRAVSESRISPFSRIVTRQVYSFGSDSRHSAGASTFSASEAVQTSHSDTRAGASPRAASVPCPSRISARTVSVRAREAWFSISTSTGTRQRVPFCFSGCTNTPSDAMRASFVTTSFTSR